MKEHLMAQRYYKLLLPLALFLAPVCYADVSQTIQIHTRLSEGSEAPSWLLIIYDLNSSAVYPYLYDLIERENFFLIFTNARHYRVLSILQFNLSGQKINNFCNFPQGAISNESLDVTVTGVLTPNPATSHCQVLKYKSMPYAVKLDN
jgi:hypothetical protein